MIGAKTILVWIFLSISSDGSKTQIGPFLDKETCDGARAVIANVRPWGPGKETLCFLVVHPVFKSKDR